MKYQNTFQGSKFLLYDSWYDEDEDESNEEDDNEEDDDESGRILIFATVENLRQLFRCNTWFVYGTFKTRVSRGNTLPLTRG